MLPHLLKDGYRYCFRCNGHGFVYRPEVPLTILTDPNGRIGNRTERCSECGGTGQVRRLAKERA